MKFYEIWDSSTGNRVAESTRCEDLLRLVRDMVAQHGVGVATSWGLTWDDDQVDADDESVGGLLAEGRPLVELALALAPAA